MSLKSSEEVIENNSIEFLEIVGCKVNENKMSNALHSLSNLTTLHISNNNFETPMVDAEFLNGNANLEILRLGDQGGWNNHDPLTFMKLEFGKDMLQNLTNLKKLFIEVREMSHLPENFFENNQQLQRLEINCPLEEFPVDLPISLEYLSLESTKFKRLRKRDLKDLVNLIYFVVSFSELEKVDEDAFYGLEKVRNDIMLDYNKLEMLLYLKHAPNSYQWHFANSRDRL